MRATGERFDWLIDDLGVAVDDFVRMLRDDKTLWTRALPRKWSAGQHADHVARGLAVTADALGKSEEQRRAGTLARRPFRGPLQMMFIVMVVNVGKFPRGGRAPKIIRPVAHPDRAEVLPLLPHEVARHRELGASLSAAERERLWIRNPFMKGWHYAFPEVLRMQAVHVRHHARLIGEIAGTDLERVSKPGEFRPARDAIHRSR